MDFNEANKAIHPIETQWHYKTMIEAGYVPETKEAVGFVRTYIYKKDGHEMQLKTGASADYWFDVTKNATGYHGSLKGHLTNVK